MKINSLYRKMAPFGFRHEIAKRYTLIDYLKSLRVKRAINSNDADLYIADLIALKQPGLVGRLGGTEARFIGEYLKLKRFQKIGIPLSLSSRLSRRWKTREREVFSNAGFYFDTWDEVENFCQEYSSALLETDILGAWGVAFTWVESIFLDPKKMKVIPVGFTAPWIEPYVDTYQPWALSLEGKKVLIVSGFSNSIEHQHSRISRVFPDTTYPNFELCTVRAPIVTGQRSLDGRSWFDLLEAMKAEILGKDFDVALIAAGAFSYPLAAYVKKLGKIGIHCGGGLQLFFGVMGNRWNKSPEVLRYVNEFWVRPSKAETPSTATNVENACYW